MGEHGQARDLKGKKYDGTDPGKEERSHPRVISELHLTDLVRQWIWGEGREQRRRI